MHASFGGVEEANFLHCLSFSQASAHGLAQKIFMPPACIFHQFHEQGTMPERVARTVGEKEVENFIANVTKMLGEGKPMVFNGGDWGYGQQSFEEHLID